MPRVRGLADRGSGVWGSLVGPLGRRDSLLVLGTATVAAGAVAAASSRTGPGRTALLAAVAFDLAGGLVSFQLEPTRTHYASTTSGSRLAFAAAHVQPMAVPLTGQGTWRLGVVRWLFALAATSVLEIPPLRRRRVVANTLAAASSIADLWLSRGEGQRWLGPVYLMKVVGGHGGLGPH